MTSRPYYRCPDCKLKGVSLRRRPAGGRTHYACRFCIWYAFVEVDTCDYRFSRERLALANPGVKV